MLVDSHCHLNRLVLKGCPLGLEDILVAAKENGVEHILNISVTLDESSTVIETANHYPNSVSASVGLHPSEIVASEPTVDDIIELAQNKVVVAIGETGLDYHYDDVSIDQQQQRLRTHIAAAKELNKPLIIHLREASEDMLRILKDERADKVGGVMHCFTDTIDVANELLSMGFYIGFSGIVTFKNADQLREVAKIVPLDRMLVETDAPYLAPVPFRGHSNEPKWVRVVAEYLADHLEMRFSDFAKATTENFYRLFSIKRSTV